VRAIRLFTADSTKWKSRRRSSVKHLFLVRVNPSTLRSCLGNLLLERIDAPFGYFDTTKASNAIIVHRCRLFLARGSISYAHCPLLLG
jgi:hypothetical protein